MLIPRGSEAMNGKLSEFRPIAFVNTKMQRCEKLRSPSPLGIFPQSGLGTNIIFSIKTTLQGESYNESIRCILEYLSGKKFTMRGAAQ